jgi:hypothetical protein
MMMRLWSIAALEGVPPFQSDIPVVRIDLLWAIAICMAVLLVGTFIGLLIGWILTGRDLQRARVEIEQLRVARDTAIAVASGAREHPAAAAAADAPRSTEPEASTAELRATLSSIESQLAALQARLSEVERDPQLRAGSPVC